MVAVDSDRNPAPFEFEFVSRAVLLSGTTVHGVQDLHRMEHVGSDLDHYVASIATTERTSQLASMRGETFASDLAITILQPIVDRLGVRERRLGLSTAWSIGSASQYSGGRSSDESLFAYSDYDFTANEGDIYAAVVWSTGTADSAGYTVCMSEPNATGGFGFMTAFGGTDPTGLHALHVTSLPPNTFGLLIASRSSGSTPNPIGRGTLCLSGGIGRFPVFSTGTNGQHSVWFDPRMIPQPSGAAAAGAETWYFQAWHRDTSPAGATSNYTNAVAIPFR